MRAKPTFKMTRVQPCRRVEVNLGPFNFQTMPCNFLFIFGFASLFWNTLSATARANDKSNWSYGQSRVGFTPSEVARSPSKKANDKGNWSYGQSRVGFTPSEIDRSPSKKPCAKILGGLRFQIAVPPEIKKIIDGVPQELISPVAPTFEQLRDLTLSRRSSTSALDAQFPLIDTASVKRVLQIFDVTKGKADYLFVGNGMYLPYLMAKAIFEDTPIQKRIKFVPFSRELAEDSTRNSDFYHGYFLNLDLFEGSHPKKIVVVDTVSQQDSGNNHTVIQVSNAIRNSLMKATAKGSPFPPLPLISPQEAIKAVISLGILENPSTTHKNRISNPDEYSKKMGEIAGKAREGFFGLFPRLPKRTTFPYLDSQIDGNQTPFNASYGPRGRDHYWNGKYNQLDEEGKPRGEKDIKHRLAEISVDELNAFIEERAQKAAFYKRLIEKTQQVLREGTNKFISE